MMLAALALSPLDKEAWLLRVARDWIKLAQSIDDRRGSEPKRAGGARLSQRWA
jgi:hypothetical protein